MMKEMEDIELPESCCRTKTVPQRTARVDPPRRDHLVRIDPEFLSKKEADQPGLGG